MDIGSIWSLLLPKRCGRSRQRENSPFANFRLGLRPVNWAHVLLAERTYERITSYAQFFVGPQAMPVTYEVALGCNPSRLVLAPETKGHIFLYPDSAAAAGTPGIISDLRSTRMSVVAAR